MFVPLSVVSAFGSYKFAQLLEVKKYVMLLTSMNIFKGLHPTKKVLKWEGKVLHCKDTKSQYFCLVQISFYSLFETKLTY